MVPKSENIDLSIPHRPRRPIEEILQRSQAAQANPRRLQEILAQLPLSQEAAK